MDKTAASHISNNEIRGLIHPDRVHRSIYSDNSIFELEMERIFKRVWVYIGHDSEVPKPGDFVTRTVGCLPVIMSRHTDNQVYVINNSCGHRGATVCAEARGNMLPFRCPYHGWTFKPNGDLEAISMPRGYGDTLNFKDPSLGMQKLRRVENYRGFVFASFSGEGGNLEAWLSPSRLSIDDLVDRALDGKVSLVGGMHRYIFRGNWKLQFENTVDIYHVPFSHESTLSKERKQFSRRFGDEAGSTISEDGQAAERWEKREVWGAAENGHSYTGHQPIADNQRDDPVYKRYTERLAKQIPPERLSDVLAPRRHNTAFFPNMSLQALNQHVRVIRPIRVDLTEVSVWPVLLNGAPDKMNHDIIRGLNITHSAASLIQTDDLENFNRCQNGIVAENSKWVLFARGIHTDKMDNHGNLINKGTCKLPQRSLYTAWERLMTNTQ